METYSEIKNRHQAEVNAFPLGAAFGNQQFIEMMQKWGFECHVENGELKSKDFDKILSLGSGVFIRKSDREAFHEMMDRHQRELKNFRKHRNELKKGIIHELFNHEYMYSQRDEDVLSAVGLTADEVQNDPELNKVWKAALKAFWKQVDKQNL